MMLARHEFRIAAQQNIGTAAGHVGGNGNRALAARLRHDVRFALVILGVQHFVPDAHAFQDARKLLGFFNRNRAHQHRLAVFLKFLDFFGRVAEFLFFGAVDHVLEFFADHRPVGGNHRDIELIDLVEFGRFSFRRAGHARQFLVHAEVVLEGDGGERLVLALDFDAFLGFHGLVQPVAPAAAGHQASGEFIDDDDFVVLHHVILVLLEEHVGLERLLHVVVPLDVGGVVHIGQTEQLFGLDRSLLR